MFFIGFTCRIFGLIFNYRSSLVLNSVRAKLLVLVIATVVAMVTATTSIHSYLFRTHQVWSLQTSTLVVGTALRVILEHLYGQHPTWSLKTLEDINYYCKEMLEIHHELISVGVVNSMGKRIFGNIPDGITTLKNNGTLDRVLREGTPQFVEVKLDPHNESEFSTAALIPIQDSEESNELAVLVVPRANAGENDLGILVLISLFAGWLVAVIVAVLAHWGMDLWVMRPLDRLLNAIREVTNHGETGSRVEIGNATELRTLGKAFNEMLERLEHSRAALASNEKFLEAIVENIPILLEVQDATDLRFVRFNRAGEAMLDLRREELVGRTPHEVFPPEAATRYVARDQAILAAGVPVDVPEERVQTKTLGERVLFTQKIPIFDEQRRPIYLLGISEDITERRHVEEVRRFGAFQAGIAEMNISVLHNIGNAITAVIEDTEQISHAVQDLRKMATLLTNDAERTTATLPMDLVSTGGELGGIVKRLLTVQQEVARTITRLHDEGLRERVERIGCNVRHIADIVRIQQNAALPGGGTTTFSLQRAIEDALVMQGESLSRHGIDITVNIDPNVDEITTHRNRLLQALINVLKNSYEAICERQQEESVDGSIVIRCQAIEDNRMELRITDNGVGIEPDHLQDIFHFGYSTKARGSGFGLHSVANFVQEQDGNIEARSIGHNQGTELIIHLPLRVTRQQPDE